MPAWSGSAVVATLCVVGMSASKGANRPARRAVARALWAGSNQPEQDSKDRQAETDVVLIVLESRHDFSLSRPIGKPCRADATSARLVSSLMLWASPDARAALCKSSGVLSVDVGGCR